VKARVMVESQGVSWRNIPILLIDPGRANRRRKLVLTPVAVEKLPPGKIVKTKSRQDAL